MGWLQQSYKQSQLGRHAGGIYAGWNIVTQGRMRNVVRRPSLCLAAFVATALLDPLEAVALEPGPAVQAAARDSKSLSALHKMSEEELRRVSGQGLTEDRLFRVSRYSSSGFGVEVLGDMATLLNPVQSLLDADITFKDAVYNPLNPTVLIDRNGSFMVRLPDTIGTISVENVRIRGSNGKSFGSVTIRDIDTRGTTIRVTVRR